LLAWSRYDPTGCDVWFREQGIELYWEKYTVKIQDAGYLNVWATKN